MIPVYSARQVDQLVACGRILAEFWEVLRPLVAPGAVTADLDSFAEAFIRERGADPAF